MFRRISAAVAACAVAGLCATASAGAAPAGSACIFEGGVTFKQPLNSVMKDFAYTFSGTISCESSTDDTMGLVSAGENMSIGGVMYKPLSTPAGNGTCNHSNSTGEALIRWGSGKLSVLPYETVGSWYQGGYTQFRSGTITLTRVTPDPQDGHTTDTFPLAHGGTYAAAPLTLRPDVENAHECATDGAKTGAIQGVFGFGSYQ